MARMISTFLCLLTIPFLVSAVPVKSNILPQIPSELPSGTTRIAYDRMNHILIAFNSAGERLGDVKPANILGRRDNGSCTALSSDDLQTLPGWSKLEAQAQTNWGSGSHKVVTNPDDYKNYPANLCVSPNVVQITEAANPTCNTNTQTTTGENVGTDGTVTLSAEQGTSFSTSTTVTQEASVAVGVTVSASVEIPEVADVSTSVTTTLSFTNTQSTAKTSTTSNTETESITINSDAGKTCSLSFTTTSCTINGSGQVQYLASGWAWFDYDSKTDGHYEWALSIEDTISDADRSSYMGFTTSISANTKSNYTSVCV